MPKPAMQTSIHGRRFGLSNVSDLIFNDANAKLQDAVLEPLARTRIELTAVQIRAGFSGPTELIAAPGAGYALLLEKLTVSKAAGTAFGGIAAGEDLIVVHSGGTDPLVTTIETTGFLDQTTDEMRIARAVDVSGTYDLTALANTAIDYELLVGDITLGGPVVFDLQYHVVDLTALLG